ncbi:SEA (Seh1-associated) complex subunit [Rhodosporidiobolus nylandii]
MSDERPPLPSSSSSSNPFQPQIRQPKTSSAFSRLTNLALSSSSGTGSTSSSPASVSVPSSSLPPAAPGRGGALDALEHIAHADQGRQRHSSTESAVGGVGGRASGGRFNSSTSRRGWRSNRDSSESRSRERGDGGDGRMEPALSITGASGYAADSPLSLPPSSYAGSEVLPPNATSYASGAGSSFLSAGDSHFFQPGVSAFSFEAGAPGGWDRSYRSPTAGSPSIFDDWRPSLLHRSSTNESSPLNPRSASSLAGSGSAGSGVQPIPVQLWDLPTSGSSRSFGSSAIRTTSPLGGGRKAKDASRGLRFPVQTVSRDKGLVGLAKPAKETDLGRVAVAGKTCLKILKVPHDRARGAEGFVGRGVHDGNAQTEEIVETMDVRLGSRLGPAYLFSDVSWGFGGTSNKLATSFTNGAVVLWDLAKEGGSRLDQLKYEHDRAVNRVVFGGMTGSWLMSGGQDGQMKLWDVRDTRPAQMILKAASPVRHLSFSPSSSQPFTLVAACASGTLIRYDIRYVSRQNGGATDRVAAHIGHIGAMDWRDGFSCERSSGFSAGVGSTAETAGRGKEGGWVVTGGVDKTIKIWDFSQPTLATKPVRTLYTSQAVYAVAWHPTRATELASSPLPSLALSGDGGTSSAGTDDAAPPTTPSTPGEPLSGTLVKHELRERERAAASGNAWKNEVEVWDIRRPYFPKLAIKTDEPTSALLWNDDETLWATSKTSATFLQHDVASDSYALLDSVDRPAASWNLEGELGFVYDGRRAHDVPFERPSRDMPAADTPKFRPEIYLNTVGGVEPDFNPDTFAYLANNLEVDGKFSEICENNARTCLYAGRPDAAQVWQTLRIWFDSEPFFPPVTPPATPPPPVRDPPETAAPALAFNDFVLSPTSAASTDAAPRRRSESRSGRPSFSSLRNARRPSGEATPSLSSLGASASQLDSLKAPLDAFSEESTADETDPSDLAAYYPELSSTSSDSEHELIVRARKLNALNSNRLAASLAALRPSSKDSRRSRSSTNGSEAIADDETDAHPSPHASHLPSRRNSHSSTSSSGSDLDDGDEPPIAGIVMERRSRSQKIASMHASLIANRSRRPSAGAPISKERRPLRSRDGTGSHVSSRQHSLDAVSVSRRGSVPQVPPRTSRLDSTETGAGSLLLPRRGSVAPRAVTSDELYKAEGEKHAADVLEIVKKQIKATLQDYADRGDAQLCATVCCVLRDKDLGFEPLWVARVSKTYLDLLRRLELHVPAAKLNKYCASESLQSLTQNTVIFHTSCGRCGKAGETTPHGYCQKCSAQVTKCCVCHLTVRSLYVFCAACGHGAHATCLQAFASTIASTLTSSSQPQTPLDHSYPSTPGLGTPLRAWLWGEDDQSGMISPVAAEEGAGDLGALALQNLKKLVSSCPAACGHSPCMLSSH